MQTAGIQAARLSRQQERLWRWRRTGQVGNVQCMIMLQGSLDLSHFQQAFLQTVERHEILRTTFSVLPEMELPMQVVGRPMQITCPLLNLQEVDPARQQQMLETQWLELQARCFDLEQGPLVNILLIRLGELQHVMLLQLCALCADTNTLNHVVTDVLDAYRMLQEGEAGAQEDEVLQYIDVLGWQQDLLTSEGVTQQQEIWRAIDLSGLARGVLPFEDGRGFAARQRVEAGTSPLQQVVVPLESIWQQRLLELSRRCGVSLEACILSCWQILLWRLTGKVPLVGVLCDGRPYDELAGAPGPYSQMLPFSLNLDATMSVERVLTRTSIALQKMSEKQFYFTWEATAPELRAEEQLFPISLASDTWPARWEAGGLTATLQRQECWHEPALLHLDASQIGDQVDLCLRYQPASFSQQQAQRLASMLSTLLQQVATTPQITVDKLTLLGEEDQEVQRSRWRGPQRTWPFQPLHRLFEAQAGLHPTAPAVRSGSLVLSYQQVEQQANRLAHLLRQQGLQPTERVVLCLPRTHWAIIGLLAVLKAGGCYVPLDPEQPPARLVHLAQDVTPSVIVCPQSLSSQLSVSGAAVLPLETLSERLEQQPITPVLVEVAPGDGAYVIYTSGSTGFPKGVLIGQQSVSNYTQALCERLDLSTGWHFATVSSLAADLGNTAIFAGLASGGCVHVLGAELVSDAAALSAYVEQYPLDVLKIVPSHLRALLQAGASGVLPRERLILGGEALPWSLVQQMQQMQPGCRLYNHYGPTETTVGVLMQDLGAVTEIVLPPQAQRGGSVSLGRPLANTQIYLLDEQQQWAPAGTIGELYIGGAGLAAGYLGQEEQTRQRFVQIECGGRSERVYRTGDRVREGEDGQIEFVGRTDEQVKLRGYRIEVGEIEAQLRRVEGIREAVVQKREGAAGEEWLVGYLVAWRQPAPDKQQVWEALRAQVPEYLVPQELWWLEEVPLTTNGKVDRQRLAEYVVAEPEVAESREQARTPIEEVVMELWREVLTLPEVGRSANFFRLGGHSLLATRLTARLRAVFGIEVPINWLFETPTIAQLSERVQEALGGKPEQGLAPIERVSREQVLPLSFGQQRLWFLDQWEPGRATYNVALALWVRGPLVVEAVDRSLREIERRHEVLRTTFAQGDGGPVQVIHPPADREGGMRWIDLGGLGESRGRQEAQRLANQEAGRPFDLQRGPVWRVYLGRLARQEHALLLTMHHCVSDAWSSEVLAREFLQLYRAYSQGQASPLAELPVQYADYACWQRQWLRGEVLQEQLDYWKHQLADLAPLELPTDRPRPPVQSFRGALLVSEAPRDLQASLQEFSQQEGVTLFMLLLTAFQVLLARYSGQTDISVGTAIANRTRPELEGLIGFFINTLVLRSDLSGNPPFGDLLKRVRKIALEAYTHQDIPFDHLVEVLHPERDLSRPPLFQVMFGMQQDQGLVARESLEGIQMSSMRTVRRTAKCDLTLLVLNYESGMRFSVEYNTDLFDASTIQRLLLHWQTLLAAIVRTPQAPWKALPLLNEEEQQPLLQLAGSNYSASAEERQSCLHQLFAQQVRRTPDAIAVCSESLLLSYEQLERRATQLAWELQARGVGPETLVGVAVSRSPWLLIALLGILKAGGGYVPLDLTYPAERLQLMIQDAALKFLLTEQELPAELQLPEGGEVLLLKALWQEMERGQRQQAFVDQGYPAQIAYVIFTSGSTGQPKGVQVTHRGIGTMAREEITTYQVRPESRVLQFISPSFDASMGEIVMALLAGASLVLAPQERLRPGAELLHLLEEESITHLSLTPSVLAVLPESEIPMLETLVVGGEACPAEAVQSWAVGRRFCNVYGPTENTVCASMQYCEPGGGKPSIGRTIGGTQGYVLDEYMELVPRGVIGELYLGGVGLARGYLRGARLTAERFVPHPWSQEVGARLYRTGDYVRWRQDGTLEYVGRQDRQVKLRGYRIELGEIEAVLGSHEQVRENAVMLRTGHTGETRLVAYVVSRKEGEVLNEEQIRQYLRERLPDYMVPGQWVLLEEMPHTPAGKIDRERLPALEVEQQESEQEAQSTGMPVEELLLEIWQEVLEEEQIGVHENFFDLGGHSLLATQIMTRIQAMFQVEIPLQVMFEAPTIAGLAQAIEQEICGKREKAPPLRAVARTQDLPLSFAQQRLWFLFQLDPHNVAYTIPAAVRLRGHLNTQALHESFRELAQRHESLRTTFEALDGQPVQRINQHAHFPLPRIDLRGSSAERREVQVRMLVQQEASSPFDLARGPLCRVLLLHLEEQEYVLLLTMHHIISDGWSMSILIRELSTLYQAFMVGQPSPLAPLPVQYADYALWQREWLQGEVLKEHIRYWTRQLSEARAVEVPGDYPRPAVFSHRGAGYNFVLEAELAEGLEQLSRQEGVTLFMTLLAGWQVLLSRLSGQQDIVVGTDSANRSHLETEGLIGFFINLLALRTNLHGNPKFLDVLHDVRETMLGAYAHRELPFEMIVEHLRLERTNNRTPLVNVLFVMQNIPVTEARLSEVTMRSVRRESDQAKFDIALFIMGGPQGLSGSFVYSTDLFKSETMAILAQRYAVLLRSIVAQPHTRVASLEIVTEEEKAQQARQQDTLRQHLKTSRGGRLRISGEDGHHHPENPE